MTTGTLDNNIVTHKLNYYGPMSYFLEFNCDETYMPSVLA